ncbi:MAG: carbohydrate ABC transporter permease [Defluviitaleaceae bacterium]|nr:carbohydrate ABC transporter permease [Defluviitaleaceae bacterium]
MTAVDIKRRNKIKTPFSRKLFMVLNGTLLIALCVSIILPFVRILSISLSGRSAVLRGEVGFLPRDFTIDAYRMLIENGSVFTAYRNTLFVVVIGTIINLILQSCAAYVLSKSYLPGVKFFTGMIVFTLWFGGGMIPTFLVVQGIGLFNSLWALIWPTAISTFHVIIMRTFFKQLPAELEESAFIDGCNEIQTLFRIILPLSKPLLATIALWIAVYRWNDFTQPMLYLFNRALFPLQVVLREIVLSNAADAYGMNAGALVENLDRNVITQSLQYAVIIFSTLPIMCIYPFLQKHFTKGVLLGSVKG